MGTHTHTHTHTHTIRFSKIDGSADVLGDGAFHDGVRKRVHLLPGRVPCLHGGATMGLHRVRHGQARRNLGVVGNGVIVGRGVLVGRGDGW